MPDLSDVLTIAGLLAGCALIGAGVYLLLGLSPLMVLVGIALIVVVLWPGTRSTRS